MFKPRHSSVFHSAVPLALAAGISLCAHAATTISGDYTIDHTLSTDERPLVITADATITVAGNVTTSLGTLTNNGHTVTINLESGTGRCDLLSSSMSGSTKLALMLCGCSASDWGHTGGTYLGHVGEAGVRGYVWCNEANVLPPGDIYLGTANGLSPVELNLRSYPQSVERLHLANASSTVIREGSAAVLNFTGANAGIVSAAATTPSLSIPALGVRPRRRRAGGVDRVAAFLRRPRNPASFG